MQCKTEECLKDVRVKMWEPPWYGAVCSAWSSLEDEDNPRNRFLSRALLSSWCQDVVLFLDWRTPATALPGTGVEISHIIRCCLRCGDHGAMVGGEEVALNQQHCVCCHYQGRGHCPVSPLSCPPKLLLLCFLPGSKGVQR